MGKKKKADKPKHVDDLPKEYWEAIVASDPTNREYFKRLAQIWAVEYYESLLKESEEKQHGR